MTTILPRYRIVKRYGHSFLIQHKHWWGWDDVSHIFPTLELAQKELDRFRLAQIPDEVVYVEPPDSV